MAALSAKSNAKLKKEFNKQFPRLDELRERVLRNDLKLLANNFTAGNVINPELLKYVRYLALKQRKANCWAKL